MQFSAIKEFISNEKDKCIYNHSFLQATKVVQMEDIKKMFPRDGEMYAGYSRFNKSYLGRYKKGIVGRQYQEMYCFAYPLGPLCST